MAPYTQARHRSKRGREGVLAPAWRLRVELCGMCIVDDDRDVRESLRELLESVGLQP
jgi:hypothetical protein